jgi:FkbM family methyltransferase
VTAADRPKDDPAEPEIVTGDRAWTTPLLAELDQLLDEPLEDVLERERALRRELEADPGLPVVLFGAGSLGRRARAALAAAGRPAAAFSDNNESLWHTKVDGTLVLPPAEAAARFGADGIAVVTIWHATGYGSESDVPSHSFLETRDTLTALGWGRVAPFIPLFWSYPEQTLPHITIDRPSGVLAARDRVRQAARLWSDPASLREYVSQVRWRLTADFRAIASVEGHQYFPSDLVHLGPDEVFADCGAFDGDTMREAASRFGSWRAYHAFEPDPATFEVLKEAVSDLPDALAERVHVHQLATSDSRCSASFAASGTAGAALDADGSFVVECAALDELLESTPPTFIKMDVEGAEAATLTGSSRAIKARRPILAVAAYHNQADLWELPLLVVDMADDYRFYLRQHAVEGFELVLYGVPRERTIGY